MSASEFLDLFVPPFTPDVWMWYLYAAVEDYTKGYLPRDYLLKRFRKVASHLGGMNAVIAMLEQDEYFTDPAFAKPKDWEEIKATLMQEQT